MNRVACFGVSQRRFESFKMTHASASPKSPQVAVKEVLRQAMDGGTDDFDRTLANFFFDE